MDLIEYVETVASEQEDIGDSLMTIEESREDIVKPHIREIIVSELENILISAEGIISRTKDTLKELDE